MFETFWIMWTIAGGVIVAWAAIKLAGRAYRTTQSVGFNTKLASALCPKSLKYEDPAVIRKRIAERQTQHAREEKCTRCNGTGEWRGSLGLDGICYSCGGTGKQNQ